MVGAPDAKATRWPSGENWASQPLRRNQLVEGLALDVLHHDEVHLLLGADVVDGDDVGMVQRAGRFGLRDEALLAAGVGNFVVGQDLDRHRAVQVVVPSFVNHTHAAFAELRFDPVVLERLADHQEEGRPSPSILAPRLDAKKQQQANRRDAETQRTEKIFCF